MNILAIDSAGPHFSLALKYQNQIFEYFLTVNFKHVEYLILGIDVLFKVSGVPRNAINLIGCSSGPGSFTGLRVGVTIARGLSVGWDVPLILLSSLFIYGQSTIYRDLLSVLDARKSRFYVARYRENLPVSCEYDMTVSEIEENFLLCNIEPLTISGPGAKMFYQQLKNRKNVILDPFFVRHRARDMIDLTQEKFEKEGRCADQEGPNYLRMGDVEFTFQKIIQEMS